MDTPAKEGLDFRILGEEDLDSMLELEKACFSTPWSGEQYRLLVKSGVCKLFGVSDGAGIVAYAAVSMAQAAGELEVYNIAVRPDKRRQGLGRQLLSVIMAAAGALGIKRAVLEVRAGNSAAIALYRSLNFKEIGRRRNYYTEPDEDALVYACHW